MVLVLTLAADRRGRDERGGDRQLTDLDALVRVSASPPSSWWGSQEARTYARVLAELRLTQHQGLNTASAFGRRVCVVRLEHWSTGRHPV